MTCHYVWVTPLQLWMHLKEKEKASEPTKKDRTEKEFHVMFTVMAHFHCCTPEGNVNWEQDLNPPPLDDTLKPHP